MIVLIIVALLIVAYIFFKIVRYKRLNHTFSTYKGDPLKNKKNRHYHYQNNRPDLNQKQRKPYDATFANPKDMHK